MNIEEKISLNKRIRKYDGRDSFIISLQKQLKSNKYLKKESPENGRPVRVLSDKQYAVALSILD